MVEFGIKCDEQLEVDRVERLGVKWWKQRVGVRMFRVGRAIPVLLWGVPQCSSAMAPVPAVGVW